MKNIPSKIEYQAEINRLIAKIYECQFENSVGDFGTNGVILTSDSEVAPNSHGDLVLHHPNPGTIGWLYKELMEMPTAQWFWQNSESYKCFFETVDFVKKLHLNERDSLIYLLGAFMQRAGVHDNNSFRLL